MQENGKMKNNENLIRMRQDVKLKEKLKSKKAVTLVALVVTIVVLLILAGVSLAMLSGDNGLIKQAQNASEEWEIAQDKEQLELAKQAEIAKGKGYIDVDDYFDRLENEGIVNDKDADIVDNGDGSYDVTTGNGNTFEVTPIPDKENAEDIEIDYVGQGEIVGPRINKINVTEKTKTSISIEVITRNAEEGQYTYSYKKSTESNYTQAQTTTNSTYTFTNLEENTKYDIKVKVETSEGSIEKTITVQTEAEKPPEEETPVGTITFGTATWSGGQASVQISTTSGYEIEYQIDSTIGSWTEIANNGTISNLAHNTTIYARLVNGSKRGEIQSTKIQDTTNPTVTVTKGEVTTNTIAVTVQATDNESGMIASPTYTYFIKKTTESNYQQKESNQTNSYTFTGLEQETSYDIKVEVQGDNAGNKGKGTLLNTTTGKVTEGTEQGAITFGTPTWSEGQANIQVSTNTSYKIEYQLNATTEGNWTQIENNGTIPNIPHNTTIYARLTDGNNHGDHASTTIKDTVNPTVTIQSLTAQDTTIQVTAEGTDNETGINEYIYSIKESTQDDSSYQEKTRNTTGTATIEGIEAGKTYTVKVEVTDKAGLTGSATKEIEIKKPAITNEDISNNPEEYFGEIVSNYDCPNNAGVNAWQIFYADENNLYLISDDYVHKDYIPNGSKGSAIYDYGNGYKLGMDDVGDDYSGSSDITDEKIKALNNDYFTKGYSSTSYNMKAVAYMLDTNAWSVFAGEQAEYAIGGPTIELLFESYNKRNGTEKYKAVAESKDGYLISSGYGYGYGGSPYMDDNESFKLYRILSQEKALGYWIASPCDAAGVFHLTGDNSLGLYGSIDNNIRQTGFRPVVCLKSGVALEEQSDGTYHIVETVRSGKITFGEPVWEEDQASVTVSTNTNFQIEYQVNKVDEGSWTNIANNGTITGLKDGDTVYARLTDGTNHGEYASLNIKKEVAGTSYDTDTDIEIGGYPVTIPAGATISKIPGEYESVEDGVVIYITNGEEITNWNADTNSNSIPDVQENYDQFVWIPVDKDSAIIEEGKEITGSTDEEKYESLQNYVSSIESPANGASKYPMAVKKTDGTYSGILYGFVQGNIDLYITPKDYTTTSSYREPDIVSIDSKQNITESSLQEEYKIMIERVEEKGGFWVGRYETTNMNSSNFTTNAVNVVRGTKNGISEATWYTMYKGQKAYKNAEENTSLKNSATASSMIWGSQWDQIMLWMKDVKNSSDYYITNAIGMGNYETLSLGKTGGNKEYKVKNIYDLAGNVSELTLEADGTEYRTERGGEYVNSVVGASYRTYASTTAYSKVYGSRLTLY